MIKQISKFMCEIVFAGTLNINPDGCATALRAAGLNQAEVAKRMGMSERAVRTWLKRGAAPCL